MAKKLLDATSHAEITAIRNASRKLKSLDLYGATVYSSMEPCIMCFAACYWAKVEKIVYAISKEKLSRQRYEGLHDIRQLNKSNNHQIEILYLNELEPKALKIVRAWGSCLN